MIHVQGKMQCVIVIISKMPLYVMGVMGLALRLRGPLRFSGLLLILSY